MKKANKSRLAGIPAWALSLMTFFLTIGIWEIFENINLPKPIDTDIVILAFYIIFLTATSFIICKTHPKSVWYTPFICNAMIIFILIVILIDFTSHPDIEGLIFLGSCVVLSVVGAIIGARMGRSRIEKAKN